MTQHEDWLLFDQVFIVVIIFYYLIIILLLWSKTLFQITRELERNMLPTN